jgi:hypothetical protein
MSRKVSLTFPIPSFLNWVIKLRPAVLVFAWSRSKTHMTTQGHRGESEWTGLANCASAHYHRFLLYRISLQVPGLHHT